MADQSWIGWGGLAVSTATVLFSVLRDRRSETRTTRADTIADLRERVAKLEEEKRDLERDNARLLRRIALGNSNNAERHP